MTRANLYTKFRRWIIETETRICLLTADTDSVSLVKTRRRVNLTRYGRSVSFMVYATSCYWHSNLGEYFICYKTWRTVQTAKHMLNKSSVVSTWFHACDWPAYGKTPRNTRQHRCCYALAPIIYHWHSIQPSFHPAIIQSIHPSMFISDRSP